MFEEFKDALHRLKGAGANESIEALAEPFLDRIKQHLIRDPEPVFELLRNVKPILIVKNYALVTRYADVQEVLARDQVFQVPYGPKMEVVTGGRNFFLGMPNSPEYERDTAHMRSAMRRSDVPAMAAFFGQTAETLVAASGGAIDAVQLSRTVPVRWVGSYFGCPAESENDAADWATTIFQYLFTDIANDPAFAKAAADASAKTRTWLDASIARRKQQGDKRDVDKPDDVLGRCLAMQAIGAAGMDDEGIRDNLMGLIAGAIPTTSKCCAQALDQLLQRPDELAAAQQAARSGDDTTLAQYVFEALRFNPNNPALFRIAAEDYAVAQGDPHATLIPKGTNVVAATQSAMFDGRAVEDPNEFRIGRPDYLSMHFGYGLHTCFGQYVNRVQIPAILKPLLRREGLERAGDLEYNGPFPSSLKVRFRG